MSKESEQPTSHLQQRMNEIYAILCAVFPNPKIELNYTQEFEFLFAIIMSAQTTDIQVNKLTSFLFKKYTSLDDYINVPYSELVKDMSSIGLYRAKAMYLKKVADILTNKYNSSVPYDMELLQSLPGVGRKTANVFMSRHNPQGIAVDTHVIRIARLLGLTSHTNPLKIEQDLMALLPQDQWGNLSIRLILYGRNYSPARGKPKLTPDPLEKYIQK